MWEEEISPYETPPLKRCETTSKFDQSVELFGWNVLWTIFQQESGLIRNSMKFTKWNCWCFIWSCLGCFSPLKIWLLIKWDRFYPKRYYNMFEGTWRHYIDHPSKGWSFLQESQWKPSVHICAMMVINQANQLFWGLYAHHSSLKNA